MFTVSQKIKCWFWTRAALSGVEDMNFEAFSLRETLDMSISGGSVTETRNQTAHRVLKLPRRAEECAVWRFQILLEEIWQSSGAKRNFHSDCLREELPVSLHITSVLLNSVFTPLHCFWQQRSWRGERRRQQLLTSVESESNVWDFTRIPRRKENKNDAEISERCCLFFKPHIYIKGLF